jgi:type II secretory pathway component GspD/PulD (secretin)
LNEIYTARGRKRSGQAQVTITVPRGSNRLLVSCSETDLPEVKALIAQLDQVKGGGRDVQIVQVQHLTPDEMAKTLTDFMRRPGKTGASDPTLIGDVKIVASTSASAVVLTGPPDRLKELADVVRRIDSTSPTTQPAGRLVRVMPLKNSDPNSVASVIMQSYTKTGTVAEVDKVTAVAEWTTNSVVVNANAAKQEEIAKLIDELDKQPGNSPQQAIIPLKHARAEDLANVLTQTFKYGKRARSGDQPIIISSDANTNSLVVAAGRADLEGIKTTVESLDQPAMSSIEELRVIPLQYIDAAETLTIMQEYLRKPGGMKGRTGSDLVGDIRLQSSPTLNALMVSGSKTNLDRVEEIVKGVDKEIPGAGTAPKIIKMEHAAASQVATTLSRIFSDQSKSGRTGQRAASEMVPLILADDSTNSLVVRARTVDYNLIEDMARKLDTETSGTGDVDIIPISRSRDPKTLADMLRNTINEGEKNRLAQSGVYRTAPQVTIGIDEQGPALIVAGSPELFKKVRELVAKLDDVRPVEGNNSATIVIQPRNLKADDMKRILNQVIQQQKAGNNGITPSRRQ